MEDHRIDELLSKYWEGETSLQEEQFLQQYFTSGSVRAEHEAFTPLFQFFSHAREEEMKAEIKELPVEEYKEARTRSLRSLNWIVGVAASLVLLLGIFFSSRNDITLTQEEFAYEDTYDSPELAYEEFKKAMYMVSSKMNKGMSTAASTLEKMEPLDEILN